MNFNFRSVILVAGLWVLACSCSQSDDPNPCGSLAERITDSNICLAIEHTGLSAEHKVLIRAEVDKAVSRINDVMPIDNLIIRIVEDPQLVIPEIGIGGFNPNQNEVIIAIDSQFGEIDNTLEMELFPLLAHETHHAKRRRSVGYGNTLFEAIITEGLADHFSVELAGISPPPWSVALTGDALQEWIDTASNTWNESSYSHSDWFLGTDANIPRWTGYSIGYELVNNYLQQHPGKLPSGLHNEPASSFLP